MEQLSKNRVFALTLIVVATFGYSTELLAGPTTRDCYKESQIQASDEAIEGHEFVLIDETTQLNDSLKQMVILRASHYLREGYGFSVGKFSSFVPGRTLDIVSTGVIQQNLPADVRDHVSMSKLKHFDSCRGTQKIEALQNLKSAINSTLNNGSNKIIKSDIIASLKEFSRYVRQAKAKRKVVFLVSDMLENSSYTSFYGSGKNFNIESLLAKLKSQNGFADFGGAKVVVLGAGVQSKDENGTQKGNYQNQQFLDHLQSFWSQWFSLSDAEIIDFGRPSVINDFN